jgi:hypothetical protein
MKENYQIICFIAPEKFLKFLNSGLQKKLFINGSYLDNGRQLVYVSQDGLSQTGLMDAERLRNAAIVLVPDVHRTFAYIPIVNFKVLFHTATKEERLVTPLRKLPTFAGELKSIEEEQDGDSLTPYKHIGQFMSGEDVTFQSIYNAIPPIDPALEASLALLLNCQNEGIADLPLNTALADKHAADFRDFCETLGRPTQQMISRLRDQLVGASGEEY